MKSKRNNNFMLFFQGGITYGEISLIKKLEKELDIQIMIGCTNIIN